MGDLGGVNLRQMQLSRRWIPQGGWAQGARDIPVSVEDASAIVPQSMALFLLSQVE